MGTEFFYKYIPKKVKDNHYDNKFYFDNGQIKIGKRSAAGLYCWDCGITLCKKGVSAIHVSCDDGWYKKCPKCGKFIEEESIEKSSVGRELGFNKSEPKKKTGVKSCASFTWWIDPAIFSFIGSRKIENEYGETLEYDDFLSVLRECPIQFVFDHHRRDIITINEWSKNREE